MLLEDKVNYIKELMNEGYIIVFVGDGVNDSLLIVFVYIGIVMGGGMDVVIEILDVVLMNDNINKLLYVLGLVKVIKYNMI